MPGDILAPNLVMVFSLVLFVLGVVPFSLLLPTKLLSSSNLPHLYDLRELISSFRHLDHWRVWKAGREPRVMTLALVDPRNLGNAWRSSELYKLVVKNCTLGFWYPPVYFLARILSHETVGFGVIFGGVPMLPKLEVLRHRAILSSQIQPQACPKRTQPAWSHTSDTWTQIQNIQTPKHLHKAATILHELDILYIAYSFQQEVHLVWVLNIKPSRGFVLGPESPDEARDRET